jgi:Zn-dependent protease
MLNNFNVFSGIMGLLVFIPAVTIHEFAHAYFAYLAGDDTPKLQKRVNLNPVSHLDPMGTVLVFITWATGFGLGWGKPVMVNANRMRNPRWGQFLSVIMGPVSNLMLALICAIIIRLKILPGGNYFGADLSDVASIFSVEFLSTYVFMSLYMNLGMFVFNLIPLGPLDGHWIVGTFLPNGTRERWFQFCRGPGTILLLAAVFVPIGEGTLIGYVMQAPMSFLQKQLLGL